VRNTCCYKYKAIAVNSTDAIRAAVVLPVWSLDVREAAQRRAGTTTWRIDRQTHWRTSACDLKQSSSTQHSYVNCIYITTHSQTTIFCIVSRVDKRYNTPDTGCLECYRQHASVNTTTPKIDRKHMDSRNILEIRTQYTVKIVNKRPRNLLKSNVSVSSWSRHRLVYNPATYVQLSVAT